MEDSTANGRQIVLHQGPLSALRRDFVNRATIKKAMYPSYRTDSSMPATAASPVGSRRYRPLRYRS
jgi:hypothetical protein